MLQAIQLEHVLACYRDDVGTLRRLLTRVSLPLDSAASLPAMVLKLDSSRTFRRDLSLHIVSMAYMHGQNVSPADLLGIVALAAAGTTFAAAADQASSQALLQLVMEVCDRQDAQTKPLSVGKSRPKFVVKLLAVSAACLLLLAFGTLLWKTNEDIPAPVVALASFPHGLSRIPMFTPSSVLPPFLRRSASEAQNRPSQRNPHNGKVSDRGLLGALRATAAPTASPTLMAGSPLSAGRPVLAASTTTLINKMPAAVSTTVSTAGYLHNAAIPTAVLSQRLGARTLPTDAYDDARFYDTRTPRLLRRQPSVQMALADGTGLPISEEAAPVIRTAGPSAVVTSGIVRPVSLGIMAGNIVYSPTPVYPPAASAAHVQGEVKVQAEIDRDGNVASVRAISGPPLLRDAAVYAVQRWRYRPYLSAGKPVSTSALAVMEFELP